MDSFSSIILHMNLHTLKFFALILLISRVRLFLTPWTVAHQAPLCIGFPRQEHWSVIISFSRGSFWPRDQTGISCNGSEILYCWHTRKIHSCFTLIYMLSILEMTIKDHSVLLKAFLNEGYNDNIQNFAAIYSFIPILFLGLKKNFLDITKA